MGDRTAESREDDRTGKPAPQRIKLEQHSGVGLLWFGAWLFTIGYLNLGFWKGVLALFVWPFYLGDFFSGPPAP